MLHLIEGFTSYCNVLPPSVLILGVYNGLTSFENSHNLKLPSRNLLLTRIWTILPRLALLPAAPRNCACKFIQTPNKVEVEVEVGLDI